MRAEGGGGVPHAWVSAPWAAVKPLQGSPAPAKNLLGFRGADGLGRKGAPGVLDQPRKRQSLGRGTAVKSSWQGQCWPLAQAAKPRPTCWHRRGRRRHPESRRPQEALSAAPWPGVLMEQAGSGRSLLTSPPKSRQNRERAPHPRGWAWEGEADAHVPGERSEWLLQAGLPAFVSDGAALFSFGDTCLPVDPVDHMQITYKILKAG